MIYAPPAPPLAPRTAYPWSLTLAGVVAMASLYLTLGNFSGLPVIAAALVLARLIDAKLPNTVIVRLGLRAVAFAAIVAIMGWPAVPFPQWYVKSEWMRPIGTLLAADMAIRAWTAIAPAEVGKAWGRGLIVSACIMICSTTTPDRNVLPYTAPAHVLLMLLAARALGRAINLATPDPAASRPAPGPDPSAPPHPKGPIRLAAFQRGVAIGLAMAIGFAVVASIMTLEQRISGWAVELLRAADFKKSGGEIGLSAETQLKSSFDPYPSPERVLRIEGSRGERHLRVVACDTYASRTWTPRLTDRTFFPQESRSLGTGQPGRAVRLTALSDSPGGLFPIPSESVGAHFPEPIEREPLGAIRIQQNGTPSDWDIDSPGGEGNPVPMIPPPTDAERAAALKVPEGIDPEVVRLARDVAGDGLPADRVHRLAIHLRNTHKYSLTFVADAPEPLNDFILNGRDGHCQFFASALVVMSRAAGVPARFVTGYYAHEPDGDDTIVRARDAHAWAECYIDGQGWITVDATPAGGRPDGLFPDKPAALRRFFEYLSDLPRHLRDWATSRRTRALTGIAAALALASGLIYLAALAIRSRRRPHDASLPIDPRLADLRERFEHALRRNRITVPPTATWTDIAATPSTAPRLQQFITAYNRARYGALTNETYAAAAQALEALEHA